MYKNRSLESLILKLSDRFKVLLVTGARQVGKTTLLKHCQKDQRQYISLDDLRLRHMAIEDPEMFIQKFRPPIIIDEIQYAPKLLSYIKMEVDNLETRGNYWLTGSQKFQLMQNITESLAGRVAIINLEGLSLKEIDNLEHNVFLPTKTFIEKAAVNSKKYNLTDIYQYIWKGSYPELYTNTNNDLDEKTERETFYSSYLQTYIERDIKDLQLIKDELIFLKFMRVLASRTSQVLNYENISQEVEISANTIKSWVSLLVSSNIIYLLPPYFSNLNKRITKTPKIYFMDTGLCSFLTNWTDPSVLESGAMNGAILETFVVSEIIKSYHHNLKHLNLYYYRDNNKKEIDLLIEQDGMIYPVEIKKTSSPNKHMIKNFSLIPKDKLGPGAVICLSKIDFPIDTTNYAIPVSYI